MMTLKELTDALKAHALAHYNDGGWDVIVECWTDDEIATQLREDNVIDVAGAIRSFADLVDVWADRQADERNSREPVEYWNDETDTPVSLRTLFPSECPDYD